MSGGRGCGWLSVLSSSELSEGLVCVCVLQDKVKVSEAHRGENKTVLQSAKSVKCASGHCLDIPHFIASREKAQSIPWLEPLRKP